VVVDEDVDPTDIHQVLWAMATRFSPEKDIDVLRTTWSTWLDPTKNPPEERVYGSKALINACKEHKYLKVFSPRNRIRREVYDRLAARWSELGLQGHPPRLTHFEEDESAATADQSGTKPAPEDGSGFSGAISM
jgi:4-hydroxy-3-polyprenylbenzoate decarboxylase